jgi:pimeloyl-ACP methyl ester carboxylesterase
MLVQLPDGRALDVAVAGPEDGTPLVFHYGTPSGPVPFAPIVDAAARHGLRTVVYARPGYRGSTPRPGRTVADAPADTAAVLDALGAGTFVTLGWSGGGPHALACAALLPDRCAAAGSIAGVAPYGAAGLDWHAGMGADNVEEFAAASAGEAALSRYLEEPAKTMANVSADDVGRALGDLASDVDRRRLTGEFAAFLAASFRAAVATGIAGWRDDDLAFVRHWGFPLGASCPITIWQGGQDRMVPYAHGEWLADHIPDARAHLLPEEGHLSLLVGAIDEIVDDLVTLAAPRMRPGP